MSKPDKGIVSVEKFDLNYFQVGDYVSFLERQYPSMDVYPRHGGQGVIEAATENELSIRYLMHSTGNFIYYKAKFELFSDMTLTIDIIHKAK